MFTLTVCGQADAAPLPTGNVTYSPFEIAAGVRRVAAGSLDKGNMFATREVSEFQVRWRGKRWHSGQTAAWPRTNASAFGPRAMSRREMQGPAKPRFVVWLG